jgi:hypothetical protein
MPPLFSDVQEIGGPLRLHCLAESIASPLYVVGGSLIAAAGLFSRHVQRHATLGLAT